MCIHLVVVDLLDLRIPASDETCLDLLHAPVVVEGDHNHPFDFHDVHRGLSLDYGRELIGDLT